VGVFGEWSYVGAYCRRYEGGRCREAERGTKGPQGAGRSSGGGRLLIAIAQINNKQRVERA